MGASAFAQQNARKVDSPAKLELRAEVATTDDNGNPSSLRITIKNVGAVAVDMPILKTGCSPDNGIRVQVSWVSDAPTGYGVGSGGACGTSEMRTLLRRVQHEWVRLRPGESMSDTERLTWSTGGENVPGTVEYWVEYTPPNATSQQVNELMEDGYYIPTEKLETEHSAFHVPAT
jgi:hypothetical protein